VGRFKNKREIKKLSRATIYRKWLREGATSIGTLLGGREEGRGKCSVTMFKEGNNHLVGSPLGEISG